MSTEGSPAGDQDSAAMDGKSYSFVGGGPGAEMNFKFSGRKRQAASATVRGI